MVANTKGGSKHKKAKRNAMTQHEKIVTCDESGDEHYAYVSKAFGNGHFGVCLVMSNKDGHLALSEKEYRGRISGRMRKQKFRNFVRTNDLVLIAKREFQTNDEKVDIIHVYKDDAVRKLVKMGHVPLIDNLQADADAINTNIVFSNDAVDEDDEDDENAKNEKNTKNKNDTTEKATGAPGVSAKGGGDGGGGGGEWQIEIEDI
jgi:initiation factor 1A